MRSIERRGEGRRVLERRGVEGSGKKRSYACRRGDEGSGEEERPAERPKRGERSREEAS